jgi:hypothetical protein
VVTISTTGQVTGTFNDTRNSENGQYAPVSSLGGMDSYGYFDVTYRASGVYNLRIVGPLGITSHGMLTGTVQFTRNDTPGSAMQGSFSLDMVKG